MTKKHYIALAKCFAENRPPAGTTSAGLWFDLRGAVLSVLVEDNPRCDPARFVAATEA